MPRLRDTALASGLVSAGQFDACAEQVRGRRGHFGLADSRRWDAEVAALLVRQGLISLFQAKSLLDGRWKLTLGQYEIIERLGRGGMGEVFRARHALMGRMVAIKVLPRSKSTPESEAAFQREIRMLGRLDHENLVRALDAGHDGKVFYLVTELIPGLDLRRLIRPSGDGPPQPLDEAAAASVVSQAAAGLSYAHSQGLVHRDVKPSNLLVMPDGRVKVLDLGLAGSVLEEESARLGRIVGTMDYMAPEQIRSPDKAGPQADIYALGCTLYFAVTGQVPFPGGTRQDKAKRHLAEEPRPLRELRSCLDSRFCRVIEEMMQKESEDRPQSAQAVIDALRPWCPARPIPLKAAVTAGQAGGTLATETGSFSMPGSTLASWSGDASSDVTRGSRGVVPMAGDAGRSDASILKPDRKGRPERAGGGPSLARFGNELVSLGAVVWRWLLNASRIVAISLLASLLCSAAMQQLFGIVPQLAGGQAGRRATLVAWGVFWVTLMWQAQKLSQGRAPPGSGAS